MKKDVLAIVAGSGKLPLFLIEECKKLSIPYIIVGIRDFFTDNQEAHLIHIGEVIKFFEILEKNNVNRIVFAGAVKKPSLSSIKTDKEGIKLIAKIAKSKILGDDNILRIVSSYIESRGYKVIAVQDILQNVITSSKFNTDLIANDRDLEDIKTSISLLDAISSFDVGQSLIVEDGVILAIEGVEGTKEMILRSTKLIKNKKPSGVLVKISKKGQDNRFDLPTIGIDTITSLYESGLKGLAIELGGSIMLEPEKVYDLANKYNLFIHLID